MVLLKLHCEVMEATLSALVAMVSGGRDGGSPTRSTDAPVEVRSDMKICYFFVHQMVLILHKGKS